MAAKQGQTAPGRRDQRLAGRQRLALIGFGALFVLLFVGFAIAQGLSAPSVPEGDVAIVEGVPDDLGTVSEAEFKRALLQQVAAGGLKKAPKPGEKKYEELKEAALGELLDQIWIQGEAEELGIEVTPKQIATELAQIKEQNFKTEAEYQEFLKTSRFTKEDVLDRVRLQLLSTQIQEVVSNEAPQATEAEVANFYNSAKDSQFTSPASRDVRVIVNEDKEKAEAAKAELEKDSSPKSWEKIAAKYSEDPNTKSTGGLQRGLTEELLQTQTTLREAIFGSPTGVIVGPTDVEGKYFVIEVEKLNSEKVQTLDQVKAQIKSQLAQQVSQRAFSNFVTAYTSKWEARTFCADGFTIEEKCSNFVGSGHPPSAPPGCYEADPPGGRPKDCPAPVIQAAPALPGSTTVLKPEGERLPQRPRPEGLKEAAEEALGGLSEGAVPPTGEVPPAGE
ncbi:MAG TPA: peptidyl-prolyl cis-trans isomerase [Solirubrobacterales bacterium]|nr:peptidyl-prolyl cis-trans isomerase [Solirubrobacterales bacterium]